MWTTNPELATMLANPEDGYKYMQYSGQKTDWKCLECDEIIKNKVISSICNRGLSCPVCSDTVTLPEKVMFNVLRFLDLNFESQKTFKWIENRRYDFYLPEFNLIIETHGEQHYREGFIRAGGKSLAEVQMNDKIKESTARENGINNYIIIDCIEPNIGYIKKSIQNSELEKYFSDMVVD